MWKQRLLDFREPLDHPAWGKAHSRRLYLLTRSLAEAEGAVEGLDWEAVFAAAHLHDLGAFPSHREAGVDHAVRSAELAPGILEKVGFPAARVPLAQEIIRGHMFYAVPGPSREAILFRDADALEFLGAVGVARVLSLTGLDDWAPDLGAAVELLRRFSRELPGALRSAAARDLALARKAEMDEYLAALSAETGGFADL